MESLPIIEKIYSLYAHAADIAAHSEKRWRYTLAQKAEASILELLSEVAMARHAPRPLKSPYLLRASGRLETLKFSLRLMLDFKVANETKIFQAQSRAAEIGRMLGGWLKSLGAL